MSTNVLLRVESVSRHFGGIVALDGVDLEARSGEVTGLIGPNGSGKSTLFNVITGFIAPDQGRILFEGNLLNSLSPDAIARLGLYRSFQSSLNPAGMTVMENMLLCPLRQTGESIVLSFLRPGQVSRQERQSQERAWHILEELKLADKADTPVCDLSGGQKKLLSIAQALMAEPHLILLDEPVAGVNPRLIDDILEAVFRLKDQGQNFLIVEHNMQFVRQACDRVAVLDAGQVLVSGPTLETLEREEVLEAYLAAPRSE